MTNLDLTVEPLVGALGMAALKATIILALAAIVTMGVRRRSAALKHLIWTVGLGATLVVLILPVVLPAWHVVPVPALSLSSDAAATPAAPPGAPVTAATPRNIDRVTTFDESSNRRSEAPAGLATDGFDWRTAVRSALRRTHWPSAIVGFWILGIIVVLARYGWGALALHRLSRRSSALAAASGGVFARQIAREMRIARSVTFLESHEVELPLTWGIVHPRVVVPSEASEWTVERCRYVFQHELAHVRRRDACTQLVAQAASAIFWFHPLVWYAGRQMRHERERACDDSVLAHGAVASEYANDLLALVTTYGHIEHHPVALAMARRSQFEGRLLALLDPTVERGLASPRSVALVLALAIALVVPTAAMRSAETQRRADRPPAATDTLAVTADPAAPLVVVSAPPTTPTSAPSASAIRQSRRPTPAGQPSDDLFAGCASTSSSHSSNHSDSDNNQTTWTASARNGDCSFDLKSEGSIAFNSDVTAIERIATGGYLDVTTTLHGDVTRLIARSATGSEVTYEFSRNGQRTDYGADGATWLARFLITLDRHTAFAIDRRVLLLLRNGGPSSVLDEIDRIHTDHAKSLYLLRLVAGVPLDAAAVRHACESASRLTASHDLAEVLVAIADRYSLAGASVRAVFLEAARGLQPEHDLARVLLSFMDRAQPDAAEAMTMLTSIRGMNVDHDKCQVLLALARTQRLDGALRDAYLSVAGSLRFDYERTRALAAIGRR